MSVEPKEIFAYAEGLLAEDEDNEIIRRNVVGRAYYGVFLAAREKSGITDTSSRAHAAVREFFADSGKEKLSNDLNTLRLKRNRADYQIDKSIGIKEVKKILRTANKAMEELDD
jgi:uncharacterized protein (UPF0332 family)